MHVIIMLELNRSILYLCDSNFNDKVLTNSTEGLLQDCKLPPKKVIGTSKQDFIEGKRDQFETYLQVRNISVTEISESLRASGTSVRLLYR